MLKLKCGQATSSKNILRTKFLSIPNLFASPENNQADGAKPELLPLILQLFAPDEESFIQSAGHFFLDLIIRADVLHAGHELGHPVPELCAAAGAGAADAGGAASKAARALQIVQREPLRMLKCIPTAQRCHLLPIKAMP